MHRPIVTAVLLSFSATMVVAEKPIADSFYQELDVQRTPSFDIQGVKVAQQIHYTITSHFTVHEPNERGDRKIVQVIRDTKLVQADTLSQMIFPNALNELRGKTLTFEFDSSGRVIDFEGIGNAAKAADIQVPGASGVLVSNVIDDDGWKELATMTMFQPPPDSPSGKPFSFSTRHEWGNLGRWYGDTNVTYGKRRGTIQLFNLVHKLEYIPPAAGAKTALPFSVNGAKFRINRADAQIYYDTRAGRISEAREWFAVVGTVESKMLGSDVTVQLKEQQMMTIRMKSVKLQPRSKGSNER